MCSFLCSVVHISEHLNLLKVFSGIGGTVHNEVGDCQAMHGTFFNDEGECQLMHGTFLFILVINDVQPTHREFALQ